MSKLISALIVAWVTCGSSYAQQNDGFLEYVHQEATLLDIGLMRLELELAGTANVTYYNTNKTIVIFSESDEFSASLEGAKVVCKDWIDQIRQAGGIVNGQTPFGSSVYWVLFSHRDILLTRDLNLSTNLQMVDQHIQLYYNAHFQSDEHHTLVCNAPLVGTDFETQEN